MGIIASMRPKLRADIDADTFDSYYWYREELEAFARLLQLSRSGGKFDIHDRISHYLRTGDKITPKSSKPTSKFDWSKEQLDEKTVISDSYKNNQNVRSFFTDQLGDSFAFSIDLMNFMKDNVGDTLGDAVAFYRSIEQAKKEGYKQKIEPHNQFNLYTREFLEDNPNLTRADVNKCWQQVICVPRPGSKGRGIRYSRKDLRFLQ